jgi:serine/threonine protein kinase/Tol biopolymer transport system component
LKQGSRLGPYEVLAPLGAGGMGEVYRARDTRLKRDVALKVLVGAAAEESGRFRRFQSEAESTAALSHPNIVAVYDIGQENGAPYIVSELVSGGTLTTLLNRGPLPTRKLLDLAVPIAEGLAAAHALGIVHRDLKPDNILLTADGSPKIADFGLAKYFRPSQDAESSQLTTLTDDRTKEGTIVGTVSYMSPEQAKGEPVDFRSDQFSFGAVLYEMATGKRAFRRQTAVQSLAAIVQEEPEEIASINPRVPAPLRWMIERCLAKEPNRRYASTEDLVRELATLRDHLSQISLPEGISPKFGRPRMRARELLGWGVAAVLLVVGALLIRRAEPGPPNRLHAALLPPPGTEFDTWSAPPAVSPDGRRVVFRAGDGLWVRSFADKEWQRLPGTENGGWPFWSPDSQSIGFVTLNDSKLRRIRINGTTSQMIVEAPGFRGASWNREDTIIFGQSKGPLYRVAAGGGEATPLTRVDASRREVDHRFPTFLADGRHFLYIVLSELGSMSLAMGSLDSKETKTLGKATSTVAFAPPGYLLSVRADNVLVAQPFDLQTLRVSGNPFSIAHEVLSTATLPAAAFAISPNGVLVYQSGPWIWPLKGAWLDRSGRQLEIFGPTGNGLQLALSPDGRKLVSRQFDPESSVARLWLYDLDGGTNTRLTFDLKSDDCATWSPDGKEIAFCRPSDGIAQIYVKSTDGAGAERRLSTSQFFQMPMDWSLDGAFLLYAESKSKAWEEEKGDLWALPLVGERKPFPVAQNVFIASRSARFSPNGRFVAYSSEESGRFELFVQTFPRPTRRWQVSTDSGSHPRWRHDGKELFYVSGKNAIMSVETRMEPTFTASAPRLLFQRKEYDGYMAGRRAKSLIPDLGFDVTRDGARFLDVVVDPAARKPTTSVIFNWLAAKP